MPYTKDNVPDYVKKLGTKGQEQWIAIWNDTYQSCIDKGGEEKSCETKAFTYASGVVNKREATILEKLLTILKEAFEGTPSEEAPDSLEQMTGIGRELDLKALNVQLVKRSPAGYYPLQLYFQPDNQMEALFTHEGKLFKSQVRVTEGDDLELGGMQEVDHQVVALNQRGLVITKDRAFEVMQLLDKAEDDAPDLMGFHLVVDRGNAMYIVGSNDRGALYRASVDVTGQGIDLGDWVEVEVGYTPTEGDWEGSLLDGLDVVTTYVPGATYPQPMFSTFRSKDGQYRWVAISCTAVLNKVGEIDSTELFDNMVRRARETGQYPYHTFFHQGKKFKMGQADFLARDKFLYITSGMFEEGNPLAEAAIRATTGPDAGYWGHSIKYLPLGAPTMLKFGKVNVPVYRDGINIEISLLPKDEACAWFTHPSVTREVQAMNERVREALEKLLGDPEEVKQFLDKADSTNRAIEDEKMIARAEGKVAEEVVPEEVEAEEATEDTTERAEGESADEWEIVLEDEVVDELVRQVADVLKPQLEEQTSLMKELARGLAEVERAGNQHDTLVSSVLQRVMGRIETLEQDEQEKKRAWLKDLPRKEAPVETVRPRERTVERQSAEPKAGAKPTGKNGASNYASIADNTLANL